MQFMNDSQMPQGKKQESIFVSLQDGESVTGVFMGNPEHARIKFNRDTKKWEENPDGFRFRLNFVVDQDGVLFAKIFEGGTTLYTQLRELHTTGYDLEKTKVRITRKGTGTDTTYVVLPLPNGSLSDVMQEAYKMIPLRDLKWKL